MPAVTAGVSATSTTNNAALTSGSFTPSANDLLVAFAIVSGQAAGGTFSDSQSLGWTQVNSAVKNSSADTLVCAVANALAANSGMTVTFTPAGSPTSTGVAISVLRVSGMVNTGAAAIRQSKVQNNTIAGSPSNPDLTFDAVCLNGNPILIAVANGSNPTGLSPPAAVPPSTLRHDIGFATPDTGLITASTNSGYGGGDRVLWSNASPTDYAMLNVELDFETTVTAGQGFIDVTAVAPGATRAIPSGQGLLDLTPVAPISQRGAAVLQQLAKIRALSPAAPIEANPLPQPMQIRSVVPAIHRPWTSGDPLPLELTAVSPTATLRAAAGVGAVHITASQMTTIENAGLSGIGHLALHPVAPAAAKSAASGQGLVKLTPIAAATSKAALHEWGRVWFAQPDADTSIRVNSGQGLIDVANVAITAQHSVAATPAAIHLGGVAAVGDIEVITRVDSGLGSIGLRAVAPTRDQIIASMGTGLCDIQGVAATTVHGAAAGPGLIDAQFVAATTTKGADGGTGELDFVSSTLAAAKRGTAGQGTIKLTHVAATGAHAADLDPDSWLLTPVAATTSKSATGIEVGLVELAAVAAEGAHGAAAGPGIVELAGVSPDTSKAAALPNAEFGMQNSESSGVHGAAAGIGSVELVGVQPLTPKLAAIDAVSIELVGITAQRPYRKYAKTATLTRVPTSSTLIRRRRES